MVATRSRGIRTDVLIAVVGMLVILAGLILTLHLGRPNPPLDGSYGVTPFAILISTLGTTLLAVWWGFWALRIFRRIDEYKLHVERTSWFFGGLAGLLASVPIYAFVGSGGLHWLDPGSPVGRDLRKAFAYGYMLPLFMQVAGAMIVAVWMRISRS